MVCDDQSGLFKHVDFGKRQKVLWVATLSRHDSFKILESCGALSILGVGKETRKVNISSFDLSGTVAS